MGVSAPFFIRDCTLGLDVFTAVEPVVFLTKIAAMWACLLPTWGVFRNVVLAFVLPLAFAFPLSLLPAK